LLKSQILDVDRIRRDFPILKRKINGKRLVYLDNAATTQKPQAVIDCLVDYYTNHNANIHRGVHQLSIEATESYEQARGTVARFVNAGSEQELIFTRGTTESINLVRFGWAERNLRKGDLIVTTMMEHHSDIVPWQLVSKKTGASVRFVGLDEQGRLKYDDLEDSLSESPKIVAVSHSSNVLGTINDVSKICRRSKQVGAITIVDAAQSVPHMPVDVRAIGCDFLAFSGHKMLGPTGIGALYGRKELLEAMDPFQGGGDMIKQVKTSGATWNELPYKFEAGTPSIADAIALGAAVEYLSALGMQRVRDHEVEITRYAMSKLHEAGQTTIYGPDDPTERGGVISFNFGDVHPHDMASILDEEGIAVRSGHHCAQPLIEWLDVPAASRASFYIYNSFDDVDALAAGLRKAGRIFAR
jgi:cysteine desulfurase / selenocysteine lyase